MKSILIMACALSAVCANVQCMDDDRLKPLLAGASAMNINNTDALKAEHQDGSVGTSSNSRPNVYTALLDDMERGVDETQAMTKFIRSIVPGLPQPNDFYTGTLYPAGSTTNVQFWVAHNIPANEIYRSGAQLDEYVRNRQARAQSRQEQENARACGECIGQTCCWVCGAGVVAGLVTGLVYLNRWADSCDGNPYQTKCFPDLPDNTTLAFNVTDLIKKME